MQEAEQRDQPYLFKIRQSAKIKELLLASFCDGPMGVRRPGLGRDLE